jgi:hypothetical protein
MHRFYYEIQAVLSAYMSMLLNHNPHGWGGAVLYIYFIDNYKIKGLGSKFLFSSNSHLLYQ